MKSKRLLLLTFIFMLVILSSALVVNANTAAKAPDGVEVAEVTTASSKNTYGRFYVDTIRESIDFGYGVKVENVWGYSTSSYAGYDVDGYTGITGTKEAGKYYSQNVNTIIVQPSTEVIITPWANTNGSKWTLTTVKNNIKDFQEKYPGYTVVCAINGSSFDISGTGTLQYQPSGAEVSLGEVYKSCPGDSLVFGFTNNGTSHSVVSTMTSSYTLGNFVLDILDAKGNSIKQFKVNNWNSSPSDTGTSVWFGAYNSAHAYESVTMNMGAKGNYIVGANTNNTILINSTNDFYGKGSITSTVARTLNENEFGIATNDDEVIAALSIGKTIRVQREITGDFAECNDIIGTFHRLYENGYYVNNAGLDDSRAPRTYLGYTEDGTIVLSCCDGRQGGTTVDSEKGWVGMYGMDGIEEAAVLKYYGCTWGMNLDGGGSSTVVVKDDSVSGGYRVMNYPSDGAERRDGNCILIAVKQPDLTINLSGTTQDSAHVTIDINDANGIDLEKLYMCFTGSNEYLPFDDKKELDVTGLTHNTTYTFTLYYGDSSNPTALLKSESFTTLKIYPIYTELTMTEDENNYIFTFNCSDPDVSIQAITLYLGSKHAYLKDNMLTIAKSKVTESDLANMYITYSYKLASYEEMKTCSVAINAHTAWAKLISKVDEASSKVLD